MTPREGDGRTVVTMHGFSPLMTFLASLLVLVALCGFAYPMAAMLSSPNPVAPAVLIAGGVLAFAMASILGFRKRAESAAGHLDLIIDHDMRTISLPRGFGREVNVVIPFGELRDVAAGEALPAHLASAFDAQPFGERYSGRWQYRKLRNPWKNNPTTGHRGHHSYVVLVQWAPSSIDLETVPIVRWSSRNRAFAFAEWLRATIDLAPSEDAESAATGPDDVVTTAANRSAAPVGAVARSTAAPPTRASIRRFRMDRTRDPEVMRFHRNSVRATIFGLFFLAVGGVMIMSAVRGFQSAAAGARFYAPVSAMIGTIVTIAGLCQITSRSGAAIDRRRGEVTTWGSILGRRREHAALPLAGLDRVVLVSYWHFNRAARGDNAYRFRVDLRSRDDSVRVEVMHGLDETEAVRHATSVSEFLGLPIDEVKGIAEGVVAGRASP